MCTEMVYYIFVTCLIQLMPDYFTIFLSILVYVVVLIQRITIRKTYQ